MDRGSAYGALALCRRPSHAVPLPFPIRSGRPCNPRGACAAPGLASSPFARRYWGNLV